MIVKFPSLSVDSVYLAQVYACAKAVCAEAHVEGVCISKDTFRKCPLHLCDVGCASAQWALGKTQRYIDRFPVLCCVFPVSS